MSLSNCAKARALFINCHELKFVAINTVIHWALAPKGEPFEERKDEYFEILSLVAVNAVITLLKTPLN